MTRSLRVPTVEGMLDLHFQRLVEAVDVEDWDAAASVVYEIGLSEEGLSPLTFDDEAKALAMQTSWSARCEAVEILKHIEERLRVRDEELADEMKEVMISPLEGTTWS